MPASLVRELAGNASSASGTSISGAALGDTTEGNLLVAVAVRKSTATDAVTFSDSQANAWTKTIELTKATTGPQVAVAWCVIAAGKAHTAGVDTFQTAWTIPSGRAIQVVEFAGLEAAPFDRAAWATGDDALPATTSTATTTQADELLVGCFGATFVAAGHVFTAGTGYTIAGQRTASSVEVMTEYRVVAATGAYAAGCTLDATPDGWVAGILTFKAAAIGTPSGHLLASAGVGL
jgi:hypothetical protein